MLDYDSCAATALQQTNEVLVGILLCHGCCCDVNELSQNAAVLANLIQTNVEYVAVWLESIAC